jgi:DNA mismatch endonuclease (patch repair protein)
VPKRNHAFWVEKFEKNRVRDARALGALRRLGYCVVVLWECDVEKREAVVERRLARRLGRAPSNPGEALTRRPT